MQTSTKIQLSSQEMELVKNTEWLLSKRIITKKVYEMFGEISIVMRKEITSAYKHLAAGQAGLFPENIKHKSGKISQGENYQLLPYAILDYPAYFWKDRVFAIRTMFWWGNFFSVTLHLSGIYKDKCIRSFPEILLFLQKHNFFVCVNEDEWQHHFEKDNYMPATEILLHKFEGIAKKTFFKISKKISLDEWAIANVFILDSFRQIMELLAISYPACKKDLLFESPKVGSDL